MSLQATQKKKEASLDRATHFLHRYCMLIVLAEYFEEHLPDEKNPIFSRVVEAARGVFGDPESYYAGVVFCLLRNTELIVRSK